MTTASSTRRVLFVDHVRHILGGAEVNLIELLAEPGARRGWQAEVATDPEGRLHEALAPLSVPRHAYGFDSQLGRLRIVGRRFPLTGALRSLRALASARRQLRDILPRARPDVVISCTNKDHFAAGAVCRAAGIPSVWWVNDILSPDFFPWAARRAFRHHARRDATRLIAVSHFAREALITAGMAPDRVVTIHNGIPLERYCPSPRGALRRMLNISDDEPLAGILGRFTPWKGQDFFVRLAEAWCRDHPRGQFALVGHAFNEDQAFEHALRDAVRTRNLRTRVHFVPFQRDVAAALSDLDVLVHASLKPEPFGRVIIEAMAVGTPVLAARAGGVPEIIDSGAHGWLAGAGDLAGYLEGLQRLLGNSTERARLGEAGRRRVVERFSLTRVREDFDRLLDSLARA